MQQDDFGLGGFSTGLDTDFSSFGSIGSLDALGSITNQPDPFIVEPQHMNFAQHASSPSMHHHHSAAPSPTHSLISRSSHSPMMQMDQQQHHHHHQQQHAPAVVSSHHGSSSKSGRGGGGGKGSSAAPAAGGKKQSSRSAAASIPSSTAAASSSHAHQHVRQPSLPLSLAPVSFTPAATPIMQRIVGASSQSVSSAQHVANITKALSSTSSTDLVLLAREIAGYGRDARARAIRIENDLKALGEHQWLATHPAPQSIDDQANERELSALLRDAAEFEENAATAATPSKRKHEELNYDTGGTKGKYAAPAPASAPAPTRKKKILTGPGGVVISAHAKRSYEEEAASEEEDDEEYNSDSETSFNKTKKKKSAAVMTEKEKQKQVSAFWQDVEEHFSFPTHSAQLNIMKPRAPTDFFEGYQYHPAMSCTQKVWTSNDPAFRMPHLGENYRDAAERLKEEEKAKLEAANSEMASVADDEEDANGKKKKGSASAKKKPTKKTLSQSLSSMGLTDDAKLKKSLLETDKLLGGDKNSFFAQNGQTLSMRLMSMMIETKYKPRKPPNAAENQPAAATGTTAASTAAGKDKDSKSAAAKKQEYSLEKRIEMELRSIGLLNGPADYNYARELADRADDELSVTLRQTQQELSSSLETLNVTRAKIFPTVSGLLDNTSKLQQLAEAEAALNRAYTTRQGAGVSSKKKSSLHQAYSQINDPNFQRAIHAWNESLQQTGSRREITGFIADPVDIGGIPRYRLNEYPPARSYQQVYTEGVDVETPLDENGRPCFTHEIHPQHPHNPNYQAPPPEVEESLKSSPMNSTRNLATPSASPPPSASNRRAPPPQQHQQQQHQQQRQQQQHQQQAQYHQRDGQQQQRQHSNQQYAASPMHQHNPQQQYQQQHPNGYSNSSHPQQHQQQQYQQQQQQYQSRSNHSGSNGMPQSSRSNYQQPDPNNHQMHPSASRSNSQAPTPQSYISNLAAQPFGMDLADFTGLSPPANDRRMSNSMSIGNLPPADPMFGSIGSLPTGNQDFFGLNDEFN